MTCPTPTCGPWCRPCSASFHRSQPSQPHEVATDYLGPIPVNPVINLRCKGRKRHYHSQDTKNAIHRQGLFGLETTVKTRRRTLFFLILEKLGALRVFGGS